MQWRLFPAANGPSPAIAIAGKVKLKAEGNGLKVLEVIDNLADDSIFSR